MDSLAERYDFELFTDHGNAAPALPERLPVPVRGPKSVRIPKRKPEARPEPRKRVKRNWARIFAGSLLYVTVTAIALLVIQKNVELAVLTDEIESTANLLAEQEAIEKQLTLGMELKFNQVDFERYAQERLGMQKIERSQVTYVNAPEGDKGMVYEPIEMSPWQRIQRFFEDIFE